MEESKAEEVEMPGPKNPANGMTISTIGAGSRQIKSSTDTLEDFDSTFGEREIEDFVRNEERMKKNNDEQKNGVDMKYRDDPRYETLKWIVFPDDSLKQVWDIIIALYFIFSHWI